MTIETPEWARYWRPFTIYPKNSISCFICEKFTEIGRVSLVKDRKNYCHVCASQIYRRVREDLFPAEKKIHEMARELGHTLREFRPGFDNDRESGYFTAICAKCDCTVSYSVIDVIHNAEKAHKHPIIISISNSDILMRECSGHLD